MVGVLAQRIALTFIKCMLPGIVCELISILYPCSQLGQADWMAVAGVHTAEVGDHAENR